MKPFLLALVLTIGCAGSAKAVALTSGTLADYISLGSTGGTVGSTLFSDFLLLPIQNGAIEISPSSIIVNPINIGGNPGISFGVNQTAIANQLFESRISYRVNDLSILGASVGLVGSSVNFDGANTGLLGLPEVGQSLIAFDIGILMDNPVSTTFNPLSRLNVEFDLVIDGGLDGRATLASATNQFVVSQVNPIPEPASVVTFCFLFGSIATQYRFRRRSL